MTSPDDIDTIDVVEAPDEIWIAKEMLEHVSPTYVAVDWPFVALRGTTTFAYYEIIDEDFIRNVWIAKKKDAKCLT